MEENSTSTNFVEHKEQILPLTLGNIELCKIGDYQDYFYKESNKWYLHKEIGKVVLDGSESGWVKTNYTFTNDRLYSGTPLSICSHFTNAGKNWQSSNEAYRGKYSTENSAGIFKCMPLVNMTTTEFKAWLSTHNTEVYYVLQAPTDTEITDTTLISQLEAINNAISNEEQTNISGTSDGSNPIFNVEAYQSTKLVLEEMATAIVALGGV